MIVTSTDLPGLPAPRRGKVRDLYDLGREMLIIATDRVSAFDVVLPDPIPDKGLVLNSLAAFWFGTTRGIIPNHFLTDKVDEFPEALAPYRATLAGRSMLVRKARVLPVECIVRGYLAGSAWQEYRRTGGACGYVLPAGMLESERLPEPLFTPTTKAESGHDEPITRAELEDLVGAETARLLGEQSCALYLAGAAAAEKAGVILADTKFEFGYLDGKLIVVDEILTPDSSRLWPSSEYKPGGSPPSFDKQYIRDYLIGIGWDKTPPAPSLPPGVISGTSARYREAFKLLTGQELKSID
jgi:phosphoribosylaminoimidazole-succinocarboxamide synthase